MLRLQRLQLAEQAVVLGVGDGWRVQHVVGVVVRGDAGPQLSDASYNSRHRGHAKTRRAKTEPGAICCAASRVSSASTRPAMTRTPASLKG